MMKSLTMAVAGMLISAGAVFAQGIEEKQIVITGATTGAFNRQTLTPEGASEGSNINNTAVAMDLAYFLSERLGIGFGVTFNSVSFPPAGGGDSLSLSSTIAAPFLRYRLPLGDRAAFGIQIGVGIVRTSISGTGDPATDSNIDGTAFSGGAGVQYFIADNVSLNAGAAYQKTNVDSNGSKLDAAGISGGVGFSIYFNR